MFPFQLREVLIRSLAQLLYFPIYFSHPPLIAPIRDFSAHVITAIASVDEFLHIAREGLAGPSICIGITVALRP